MRQLLLLSFVFTFSVTSIAQDFSPFQNLLDKHLKTTALPGNGLQTAFDYTSAKNDQESIALIAKQSKILSSFKINRLTEKKQALAFWINSYNFFMIRVVLEKGFKGKQLSINSVKDLGSFFSPYAIFKKENHDIGGKKYSLDGIEKKTLLGEAFKKKGWKDARIHFAVNCASVGCPPLIKNIYNAKTLDTVLDYNIKRALATPRHYQVKGKTLHLTHLFKWYKGDFKEHSGTLRDFLLKYVSNPKALRETKTNEFIEYNWNLNKPKNF